MAQKRLNKVHRRASSLPFVAFVFWYVSLFPGRLSGDTSQAITLIQEGKSTDWWTGIYFQFLRVATFNGRFLFIASALTLGALFSAILYLIYSLPLSERTRSIVIPVVLFSPLAGAFGVNVSHDVFQASSIIILTAIEFRLINKIYLSSRIDIYIEVLLVLTILMNHFGLVLVVFHVLQILRTKNLRIVSVVIVALATTYVIGGINVEKSEMKSLTYPMIDDIKCIVQHPDSTVSEGDWKLLSRLAPVAEWKNKVTCRDQVNLLGALPSLNTSALDKGSFISLYLRIASQNPYLLVYQHIIRATVVLPPPFFQAPDNQISYDRELWLGFDSNSELQNGPELLHPSLDLPQLKTDLVILKPLEYFALFFVFILNQASWFWSWAGLWLYPIVFFVFLTGLKFNKSYWSSLIPVLLLAIFLILLSPQSSGRYVMGTILIGFSYLIALISTSVMELRNYFSSRK